MSGKVQVTIDGRAVSVPSGTSILFAAKQCGIEIPTLCFHPVLGAIGACRLCLVEVEAQASLLTACTQPVEDGMVVYTSSERVLRARRTVLELLLSDHPLDCITCDASGDCELEQRAWEMGIPGSKAGGTEPRYPIEDDNPALIYDPNKCILCGRCVKVCTEFQCADAIEFLERGFESRPGIPLNRKRIKSDCVFCGQCVQVCPTGALSNKISHAKVRKWELSETRTICQYCGVGCSIILQTKDNRIIDCRGDDNSPVNHGFLCVKGRYGWDFVHHTHRLTSPLIKENGRFRQASWDEALDLVASRFREIKSHYGPDAIAGLSSAKCTNEENFIMQKFMRAVIGTNNVDHCARLCHASTVTGLVMAFGSGAMTNSIGEAPLSDVILIIGTNTTENHPVIGAQIQRASRFHGTRLIVADPRKIYLTRDAYIHLQHRSGSDVALLNGLMHIILSEGLEDREFIESRTEGFEELKATVEKYTPELVEGITGVPRDLLRESAITIATAERTSIYYSMGITQHTTGTDNVLSIANLAMLTGNIGRAGSGVNPLRGQNNVQGACDMGALPNVLPGYQKVEDPQIRAKFEDAWKVHLPEKPGLTVVEMFNSAREGGVKAMFIVGENPMLSDPDITDVKEGIENLEFLVVQDIFLSETAQLADVVLPAVSFAEKDGTYTNTERRVQRIRKAVEPPGQCRLDWEIICELSARLGYEMVYRGPDQIMEEIAYLTPIYGGIHYQRLEGYGLQWPCPDESHPGTPILHKDSFTRGRGKFHPVDFIEPAELPDEEYPLILTTGRMLQHWHTGTMSRRSNALDALVPAGYVEVNPEDAEFLSITDGQTVRVSTRRGSIETPARISKRPRKGTIFLSFHFAEAPANLLTISALDPIAKIPEYKVCSARLEPL